MMKYIIILLLSCNSFTLSAQSYTDLEKARIVTCLATGKVGNFVSERGGIQLYDIRGHDFKEGNGMFLSQFHAAQFFLHLYFGYSGRIDTCYDLMYMKKDSPAIANYTVLIGSRTRMGYDESKELFLRMLPYHATIEGAAEAFIILRRIAGCSPMSVDRDYIDLLALVYFQEFGSKNGQPLRIFVDYGTDPKTDTSEFVYDQQTNWYDIEKRIKQKLNGKSSID